LCTKLENKYIPKVGIIFIVAAKQFMLNMARPYIFLLLCQRKSDKEEDSVLDSVTALPTKGKAKQGHKPCNLNILFYI
jgi:hypothetical protein